MPKSISIKPFTYESANELVKMFTDDEILRKELGLEAKEFSADEEYEFITNWSKKTNSEQYEIRYGEILAGMISLSHIDDEKKSARIGYWVGSEFRNRGICKAAFGLLVSDAKERYFKILESDIDKSNVYSLKIWEKYNPEIIEKNEKQYTVKIKI